MECPKCLGVHLYPSQLNYNTVNFSAPVYNYDVCVLDSSTKQLAAADLGLGMNSKTVHWYYQRGGATSHSPGKQLL